MSASFVKLRYPTATAIICDDGWKIYHMVGATYVSLSAKMPAEAEAWEDASRRNRQRESQKGQV